MSYSPKVYSIAKSNIDDRREHAISTAELRKNEVFAKLPRLKEIESELSSIGAQACKGMLLNGDVASQLNSLKEKSLVLQKEYMDILISNGYSHDYTEPKFVCSKCGDTGFVDVDNKTIMCDCFKRMLLETSCEELNNISPLSLSTFNTFDISLYSQKPDADGKVPFNRMLKIFNYCVEYAESFSDKSKSILMKGSTGLGKTHLSLAIANEIIKKGFSVVYVSAPDILSKIEREHFSYDYESEKETMQSLRECDLLILDDLGTEFVTPFSTTAIYNMFNTRINMGKPMIINTNMTLSELENVYSQRFISRIMGYCDKLDFIGADIRARINHP